MRVIGKVIKNVLYVIMGIILFCCLFVFASSIARDKVKSEAICCFRENYSFFEQSLGNADSASNVIMNTFNPSGVVQISIPDELLNLGIVEAFSQGGNTYFQFKSRIFGTMPYGILYITNEDKVDEWYRIDGIEGNWYYYRIVS